MMRPPSGSAKRRLRSRTRRDQACAYWRQGPRDETGPERERRACNTPSGLSSSVSLLVAEAAPTAAAPPTCSASSTAARAQRNASRLRHPWHRHRSQDRGRIPPGGAMIGAPSPSGRRTTLRRLRWSASWCRIIACDRPNRRIGTISAPSIFASPAKGFSKSPPNAWPRHRRSSPACLGRPRCRRRRAAARPSKPRVFLDEREPRRATHAPSDRACAAHIHRFEPGADPSRPPVLLLHGTGGDETDMAPLGREVAPGAALLSPRGKVLEGDMPRFFRRFREGLFDEDDVCRRAGELANFVGEARRAYAPSLALRNRLFDRREHRRGGPAVAPKRLLARSCSAPWRC